VEGANHPGFQIDVQTQRPVYDVGGTRRAVDLSLEWNIDGEVRGRVFIEIKWHAPGEHGDQLDAYDYVLRDSPAMVPHPEERLLVYLCLPGGDIPEPEPERRFRIDKSTTWREVARCGRKVLRDLTQRSAEGMDPTATAAAEMLVTEELVMALEEEGLVEPRLLLSHLAAGQEMVGFVQWAAPAIIEAHREVVGHHGYEGTQQQATLYGYLMQQLCEHERLATAGQVTLKGLPPFSWGMGICLEFNESSEDVYHDAFPQQVPLATFWLERNPASRSDHEAIRKQLRDRLVGGRGGFTLVDRPDLWHLAYRARSLLELAGGKDDPQESLRRFLIESATAFLEVMSKPLSPVPGRKT
jgi:hypothetical protein